MKYAFMIFFVLLMTITSVFAEEKELIKSCKTVLTMPEVTDKIDTQIDIFKIDNTLTATTIQKSNGQTVSYEDEVNVEELNVQAGLVVDFGLNIEKLNLAERLIVHALALTEDPIFNNTYSAGLDLRKVRSAKVYVIGRPTHMGLVAIVEAKDESGKNMGSFFGGMLVAPCK